MSNHAFDIFMPRECLTFGDSYFSDCFAVSFMYIMLSLIKLHVFVVVEFSAAFRYV